MSDGGNDMIAPDRRALLKKRRGPRHDDDRARRDALRLRRRGSRRQARRPGRDVS